MNRNEREPTPTIVGGQPVGKQGGGTGLPHGIEAIVLLAAAEQKQTLPLARLMNPVHFVAETSPLNRVLMDFYERRQHLFVVVDEYGAMTGVISLEDILEEIIGREIMDESDKAKNMRELARRQYKSAATEDAMRANDANEDKR